jgi:uncharacterized membrane protein YcaP (DUF421 family)
MEEIKWGVLEPDGKISFVPWEQRFVRRVPEDHIPL